MRIEERANSGIENRCISERKTKEWMDKCKIGMSDKSETREVRRGFG